MADPWEQVRAEVASAVSERAATETELAAQQQNQALLRRQAADARARGDAAKPVR